MTFCYRMPSSLPRKLGRTEFLVRELCVNWASDRKIGRCHRRAKFPSAKFHLSWPVSGLVNLRIWPSHAIDAHSGVFRLLTSRIAYLRGIYLPLRGQHTFGVSRLTLLHCNMAPRPRNSSLLARYLGQKSLQWRSRTKDS